MENPNTTPSAAQQPENNGSERMFTQSELNTIVADRLARERSKSAERVGDQILRILRIVSSSALRYDRATF